VALALAVFSHFEDHRVQSSPHPADRTVLLRVVGPLIQIVRVCPDLLHLIKINPALRIPLQGGAFPSIEFEAHGQLSNTALMRLLRREGQEHDSRRSSSARVIQPSDHGHDEAEQEDRQERPDQEPVNGCESSQNPSSQRSCRLRGLRPAGQVNDDQAVAAFEKLIFARYPSRARMRRRRSIETSCVVRFMMAVIRVREVPHSLATCA